MKDNADSEIGTRVPGSDGTLTRDEDIAVTASNDGHNYKCEMGFVATDNPENTISDVAKNIPDTSDAKYKCSSTAAKPGAATITPPGAEFYEGDTLTCTAPGNPDPKMQWSDTGGNLPSQNGVLTLTTDMAGKTLTCAASNNLGSETATRAVTTVEAAPTTVTPTILGGKSESTVTQTETYTSPENSTVCPRCHLLVIVVTFLSAFIIYGR